MELYLNLAVDICNGVKERLGADCDTDVMCAAYKLSEDRQTTNHFRFNWRQMKYCAWYSSDSWAGIAQSV